MKKKLCVLILINVPIIDYYTIQLLYYNNPWNPALYRLRHRLSYHKIRLLSVITAEFSKLGLL